MSEEQTEKAKLVSKYKAMLQELIDQRPAGLRGQLAVALSKHKSFISQITNPVYRVPIPARDLQTIFDICYLSTEERETFLDLYNRAHATNIELSGLEKRVTSEIKISLPAFDNPALTKEVRNLIQEFSERLIALAWVADESASTRNKR